MTERHPRSALGWNKTHFFLAEVDGRQRSLSLGMTLEELGEYMAKLGCEEAMSLDGGGSSTFWYRGRVVNSPCDGTERPVANGLVVVRKVKSAAR
ncbi:MAG TPA: phosphodiester glycosidase family protein, partial [Candidatus Binatia bacterium]|nr:phosphodiester glycosidase family protein [Candidatus Binatia bacterium]